MAYAAMAKVGTIFHMNFTYIFKWSSPLNILVLTDVKLTLFCLCLQKLVKQRSCNVTE